ncbi:MAG TPA: carboxypeptidase regulatory-like domain-containing protein [Vicinamibacterales bacterium]
MRGSAARLFSALALILTLASAAHAADTGSLSGAVFDRHGAVLADATVKISGERLPLGRDVTTGSNGIYLFEFLLPGSYTVEVDKPGVGAAKRSAVIEVGKDTQVDFVVGIALEESVSVTAVLPVVDVRSSEVSFNFKADTVNALPLERTYRGLLQLIPGVADNRSTVGPAAGGGRQDNTYLIDGVNITNVSFGYLSTEVNELDIAEVNLKRAGISAEFGRTAGTVTNAVSRSGSNRLSAIGRIDWLPEELIGGYKLPDDLEQAGVRPGTFRDPVLTTDTSVGGGLGGPIVRDRVFFYGSARYGRQTKWGRFNKVGTPLPDEVGEGPEYYGKVTSVAGPAHQLNASYRKRPSGVHNALLTADTAPELATTTDNGSDIATVEWASFMRTRSAVDVRYLYMSEHNEDTPVRDLGYLPAFNPNNLSAMGQYTDSAQANLSVGANQYTSTQNYRRHELRGVFTQLFDLARTSHTLRAGGGFEFGEEVFNRITNGWGAIVPVSQNGIPALRARYFTAQPPQQGQGRTGALFMQDDVTFANRMTLNLGVLANQDAFAQRIDGSGGCPATIPLKGGAAIYESSGDTCTFLRFGWGTEIQPRIGASYRLRQSAGDKIYGSWGRYANMDQKSSSRSLAPTRVYQTQTIFDLQGDVLSSGPLASTTGKLIDPAIEPIDTDEWVAGYATPIGKEYSLDLFYMSRDMKHFIEDVPSRINGTNPDSGPYVATNLPCTAYAACQAANAARTYRALTIDLRRRQAERWMADVSYTWSRFEGNYDLDYATVGVYNTSSIIQDAPGTYVEDPNRFGPLTEDRPHLLKAFATYTPGTRLTLSGYLRVQSGAPWNARARDYAGAVMNYLEPAGAHRNPAWTNLDLMAAYRVPVGGRSSLSLEARLLNVFDNQTQIATDSQQYLDLRTFPVPPYFAPYQQPNPFFGTGKAFAPPRRLYLTAVASF